MRMRMSFEIQRVFYCLRRFCGSQRLWPGPVGTIIFMTIAIPPSDAVAQFPGVGSEAPSGVAISSSDDVISDATYANTSVSDAGNSSIADSASIDARDFSSQSNYDGGSSGYRSSVSGISTSNLKKEHRRNQLLIKKLRLEFARIELVERKTGLPFSRDDVPRYLGELRNDLNMMVIEAENGKITEGALKSIARDAYFIETHLNDRLDHLLDQAGQPVPKKPFLAIMSALPKANLVSAAEIDALSLKFELAEYGEKALQAMGTKRY